MPVIGTMVTGFDANHLPTLTALSGTLDSTYGTAVPIPLTATVDGKLRVDASVTAGDQDGGTLNILEAGTITRVEGGSIVVTAGTVTTTLGDLQGGTLNSIEGGSIVVTAGTVTTTLGDLEGGTIDLVSAIAAGSIAVTAGTVNVTSFGADIPGGTIDLISGLANGTITNISADLPGGTIDSVTNLAGGTVQINPRPTTPVISYGTSIGGSSATGITLIAAPGSGTSIYINSIALVNRGTTQIQTAVGFGTASTQGTSQIVAGNLAASGGGIAESYPHATGGHINNLALLGTITAAGTVDVHITYWIQ